MFAISASKVAAKLQPSVVQSSRQMSVISGPPQVRISLPEKIFHGFVITGGILAIPGWVLVNIKNYRKVD